LSVNFYNMKKIFMLFVILGPLLLCKGWRSTQIQFASR
jgi:hypothetical protein